jgi:hypothetical protein
MFQVDDRGQMWPGMEVKFINFRKVNTNSVTNLLEARNAFGRAVIVDQEQCDIQVYPFYDLINANFGNDIAKGVSPHVSMANLGVSVQDFVEISRRESARNRFYESDIKRCIYASNSLQTNFVLSHGFIIHDHKLICKPERYDAMGLDCDRFTPLNGLYTALVLDAQNPRIAEIRFENGRASQMSDLPRLAVSGPVLVKNGENVSGKIPYRPMPTSREPFGLDLKNPKHLRILRRPPGPTERGEVNYPPPTTMTSFTAFGVREDRRIILVSMFEELRGKGIGTNLGITICEMAELLVNNLEAKQAILGGGGADTQQFLKGDQLQYMIAPVRTRSPGQGSRYEVAGARGLGAIIAVLAKR